MVWKIIKKIFFSLAAILIFLAWAVFMLAVYGFYENPPAPEPQFGVTFSKKQALHFGLDWRRTYREILDDLEAKIIRLPAYWDEIEPGEGNYDFADLDWQVGEAQKRNAEIILAVGLRLPRWPECHAPQWLQIQNPKSPPSPDGCGRAGKIPKKISESLLKYVEAVVNHYKEFDNVIAWQVENEPFLRGFGECPEPDAELLDKEIALVRSLDSRPVVVTDSGELGDWFRSYRRADIFGTTMYRKVWNEKTGFFKYPLPPAFFWLREGSVNLFLGGKKIIGVELQAEPWGSPHQIYEMNPAETANILSLKEMLEYIDYSRRVGLPENYLWGAEWWAWMKNNGYPQYWNLAKAVL